MNKNTISFFFARGVIFFMLLISSQQSFATIEVDYSSNNAPEVVLVEGKPYLQVTFTEPVGDYAAIRTHQTMDIIDLGSENIDKGLIIKLSDMTYQYPIKEEHYIDRADSRLNNYMLIQVRSQAELEEQERLGIIQRSLLRIRMCFPDSIFMGHCSQTVEDKKNSLVALPTINIPADISVPAAMTLSFKYNEYLLDTGHKNLYLGNLPTIEYYRQEDTSSTPILIGTVSPWPTKSDPSLGDAMAVKSIGQKIGTRKVWEVPIPATTLEAMRFYPQNTFSMKITGIKISAQTVNADGERVDNTGKAKYTISSPVEVSGPSYSLSITNDPAAALVADAANSLTAEFSRAFVPSSAKLELRQGTTVVETENLALEGSLPADQASATYALDSTQVNQLRSYLGATGLEHYLVLEDDDESIEKKVTFTGTPADLSITNDLSAALVADTANSLSANFSRAFVPATARLELRQENTVIKTYEDLALEGTLPAGQRSATYTLSSEQVNELHVYLSATGLAHYLVLGDDDESIEKKVTFTGEALDLSITNDPTAALVVDTESSLSATFNRAFVPTTARLELRQENTVIKTYENLALEDTLSVDQTEVTYPLGSEQVNQLRIYLGATGLAHYLVLGDSAGNAAEKVVTFTGEASDLNITNDLAALLLADTANSLSATFNRAFVPTTARLELRQGGSVVDAETINLTANTLPADQLSVTYTLGSDQTNTLLRHLDMADFKHYLVLTDAGDTSVEKAVMFSGVDLKKLEADATAVTQATQAAAVFMTRNAIETIGSRLSHLRRQGGGSGGNFSNNLQLQFADSRLDTLKRALVATHLGGSKKDVVGINSAWNHWVSGKVIIGQSEDDIDSHNNFDIRVQKLNYGLDRSRDRYTWGFSLGMVKHHSESDQLEVDSNSYSLSAYGLMRLGDTANSGQFLEAAIGYGTLNSDITDLSAPLNADSEREGNSVYASVAYRLAMEYAHLRISPYGRYDISVIALDAYESRSLALGIHRQDLNLSLLSLGVEVDYEFALESGTLKPYTQLEYSRDVSDYETATAYVLSSPDIAVPLLGSKQSPETWHFKLGLQYQLRRTSMYLDYERAQSPDHLGYSQYSDALELGISWVF